MTLNDAITRLLDLADTLQRRYPDETLKLTTEARLFVVVVHAAVSRGERGMELLHDTLKVCRKLEGVLAACEAPRATKGLIA